LGGSDNWCTSRTFLDPLEKFNCGPPAMDPCSNPASVVNAAIELYGPKLNGCGLALPWVTTGLVFVNPPYSDLFTWMARCAEAAALGSEVVALIPAYTDTAWFHQFAVPAGVRLFWEGRLSFLDPKGRTRFPARFPSLACYWGRRIKRFRRTMGPYGYLT